VIKLLGRRLSNTQKRVEMFCEFAVCEVMEMVQYFEQSKRRWSCSELSANGAIGHVGTESANGAKYDSQGQVQAKRARRPWESIKEMRCSPERAK